MSLCTRQYEAGLLCKWPAADMVRAPGKLARSFISQPDSSTGRGQQVQNWLWLLPDILHSCQTGLSSRRIWVMIGLVTISLEHKDLRS